jgi:hypothetical protein
LFVGKDAARQSLIFQVPARKPAVVYSSRVGQKEMIMQRQISEPGNHDGTIWGRLLGSNQATLAPEAAWSILELEFPPEDLARMHKLSSKAKQEPLTPEEQDELESYSRVGSILGIMKSKARVALRKAGKSNGKKRR